jgi:putative flippase GtrA
MPVVKVQGQAKRPGDASEVLQAGVRMKLRPARFAPSDAAMPKFAPPDRETQKRFGRFVLVGGGSAAVQFLMLAGLKRGLNADVAFSVSWIGSTAVHYLANRYWALPSTRHDAGMQFGEYLFTIALSFVINLVAFKVAHDAVGLGVMWAAFWAIPPSTIVVFLLLNYRVFRAGDR